MKSPRLYLVATALLVALGASARAASPTVPLVFIPGYAASTPRSGPPEFFDSHRGVPPFSLRLSASYDLLVRSLFKAGYRERRNFFPAVYDWRLPAAPADGTPDGTLSTVTAASITGGQFNYAVNYLGFWLDQVVQANPGAQYVDIVTHDAGGLLARAYLQSPAYGATYRDARGYSRRLPKIRYLILADFANEGTDLTWRIWKADFQDGLDHSLPLTKIEGRHVAAAFAYVTQGGTIYGPDHNITRDDILRPNRQGQSQPDPIAFYRLYAPLRQSLMPTYDFLAQTSLEAFTNVNQDPSLRSDLLLDLNALSTAETGTSSTHAWASNVGQGSRGGVIITYASGARDATSLQDFLTAGQVTQHDFLSTPITINELGENEGEYLPLLSLLTRDPAVEPVAEADFARTGDEENKSLLAGDGHTPLSSYRSTFADDQNLTLVPWGNGDLPDNLSAAATWTHFTGYPVFHDVFFTNPDVRKYLIDTLTGSASQLDATLSNEESARLQAFLHGQEPPPLPSPIRNGNIGVIVSGTQSSRRPPPPRGREAVGH